jgi:hypothetical protein
MRLVQVFVILIETINIIEQFHFSEELTCRHRWYHLPQSTTSHWCQSSGDCFHLYKFFALWITNGGTFNKWYVGGPGCFDGIINHFMWHGSRFRWVGGSGFLKDLRLRRTRQDFSDMPTDCMLLTNVTFGSWNGEPSCLDYLVKRRRCD